ncbi:MAG: DsrE/DsrF/DrsH-like family protein, partial [Proteobacteria bacterium]|nr:DsrE/DsrF/DrsH-like family protein [Pseudomonadota bacterium]
MNAEPTRKPEESAPAPKPAGVVLENKLSMVVFSGDLDKLLAAMIIATGAAAMGMKVVMFFTF